MWELSEWKNLNQVEASKPRTEQAELSKHYFCFSVNANFQTKLTSRTPGVPRPLPRRNDLAM